MATTQNVDKLLSFFRNSANKCFWDEDNVIVKKSPLGGTGVFARRDLSPEIEDEALILRISKESILSSKNSCIANLLHDEHLTGVHAMILAFLYEKSMGSASPWYDYINSINIYQENGELILPPSLWPEEEKALLKGTEAEVLGAIDITEPQEFFALSIQFAKNISNIFPVPFELSVSNSDESTKNMEKFHLFVAYCASIASRAFAIDDYHEIALVPGADLFNHDSYFNENVHFETVSDVCYFCGAVDDCGHTEHGAPDSEQGSSDEEGEEDWEEMEVDEADDATDASTDTEEGPIEVIEEITEDYIKKMEEEIESERLDQEDSSDEADSKEEIEGHESEEDIAIDGEDSDENGDNFRSEDEPSDSESLFLNPDDCADIVLTREVKEGEEIFNTYGSLSNSVLISRYGFTSHLNPSDYVGLGRQALKTAKSSKSKKYFEFWEEQGYEWFQDYLKYKSSSSHEHDHEHENEDSRDPNHDHQHEAGDSCCGTEEENGEELETSWELELRITFEGKPSDSTLALASLLTLSDKEFKRAVKYSNFDEIIEFFDTLVDANKRAYAVILEWCIERAKLYKDGGLTSEEYEKIIRELPDSHKKSISILVQSEKAILERAFKFLESRV